MATRADRLHARVMAMVPPQKPTPTEPFPLAAYPPDDEIPAPPAISFHPGETLRFGLSVTIQSTADDPHGRGRIDHLTRFMKAEGLTVQDVRLETPVRTLSTPADIAKRANNLRRAAAVRERSPMHPAG